MFKKAARQVGLKDFSLYSLRHTHITLLLLDSTPVNVVADRVGDKPERILNSYSHVIQGADVRAAMQWDSIVSSAAGPVN